MCCAEDIMGGFHCEDGPKEIGATALQRQH